MIFGHVPGLYAHEYIISKMHLDWHTFCLYHDVFFTYSIRGPYQIPGVQPSQKPYGALNPARFPRCLFWTTNTHGEATMTGPVGMPMSPWWRVRSELVIGIRRVVAVRVSKTQPIDEWNVNYLGGGFEYCLFSPLIWGRFPIWLIFFRWVETTNHLC